MTDRFRCNADPGLGPPNDCKGRAARTGPSTASGGRGRWGDGIATTVTKRSWLMADFSQTSLPPAVLKRLDTDRSWRRDPAFETMFPTLQSPGFGFLRLGSPSLPAGVAPQSVEIASEDRLLHCQSYGRGKV